MLLTILVTIDIALSTATLGLFLEHRRKERLREEMDAVEELIRRTYYGR